jgi:ferredoxin
MASRITVNADLCIASGYCLRDLPQLFHQAPDGSATVHHDATNLPLDLETAAHNAALNCPSAAIEITTEPPHAETLNRALATPIAPGVDVSSPRI